MRLVKKLLESIENYGLHRVVSEDDVVRLRYHQRSFGARTGGRRTRGLVFYGRTVLQPASWCGLRSWEDALNDVGLDRFSSLSGVMLAVTDYTRLCPPVHWDFAPQVERPRTFRSSFCRLGHRGKGGDLWATMYWSDIGLLVDRPLEG